jgi:hypothetical protein
VAFVRHETIKRMGNCSKCGAEIVGSGKFCAACGAPVAAPRTVALPAIPKFVAAPSSFQTLSSPSPSPTVRGVGLTAEPPVTIPGPPLSPERAVSRPSDSVGVVGVLAVSVSQGTRLVVNADDTFFGVADGRVVLQLGPGQHSIAQACEWGAFVRGRPERASFGGELGQVRDPSGGGASLRGFGSIEIAASSPSALVASMLTMPPPARSDLTAYVRTVALEVLRSAVQTGCGVLGWNVRELLSGAKSLDLGGLLATGYESSTKKLPGTSVSLVDLNLNGEELPQPSVGWGSAGQSSGGPAPVDPFASTSLAGPTGGRSSAAYGPPPRSAYGPVPSPAASPAPAAPPLPPSQVSPMAMSGYGGPPQPYAAPQPQLASQPRVSQPQAALLPVPAQPAPAPPVLPPQGAGFPAQQAGFHAVTPQQPNPAYAQPAPQYVAQQPSAFGVPQSPFAPQPYSPAPYPAAAQTMFGVGARVLVQWADGNRYPATVQQAATGHCLVVFPNGHQQWVELQYLSTGM